MITKRLPVATLSLVAAGLLLTGVSSVLPLEDERPVTLEETPDIVKSTILNELLREVDGLTLEELEMEIEGDKTIFEAEFLYNGLEIELEIDEAGRLLSKVVGTDDDEDGDDADDDEDDGDVAER